MLKVLIVEDGAQNQEQLRRCLADQGFSLIFVAEGEAALEQAQKGDVSLFLISTRLPGMSGFEIGKRLKALPATRDFPVIFMIDPEDLNQPEFEAVAEDYLIRPIRPRHLLARIRSYLLMSDLLTQLQATDLILARHAVQFDVTSQIGKQITSILNPVELSNAVVELVQGRLNYYFVGIWQLNDRQDTLILKAGISLNKNQTLLAGNMLSKSETNIIVSQAARSGQLIVTNDILSDPNYLRFSELPETRSEIALPLHIGPRMVGVLDIQSNALSAFDDEDCLILQSLADQVAVAIRNAELYELQNRRRHQAELLEQTGRELSSSLNIKEVNARILAQLASVLPYEQGFVYLRQGPMLRLILRRDSSGRSLAPNSGNGNTEIIYSLRPGSALLQIIDSNRPLVVDNLSTADGWIDFEKPSGCASWLGVPLSSRSGVTGILALARKEACAFGPSDIFFLATFAAQAAIALENAGLYAEINHLNEHLEDLVKQRTRQLDEAYKNLKKLDAGKADFINVAAHELRTPLTVIKGYINMMELDPLVKSNESLIMVVNGVMNGVNRLHEIVNSMLDVAKINNQVLSLACTWIDPIQIIRDIRIKLLPDFETRKINFTMASTSGLPVLYADPALLQKVFYNIIVNAIKYTPDGGTVTVSAQTLEDDREGSPGIEIQVKDTGIGIDPDQQNLIFEQFYQTGKVQFHSSSRTMFKGGGPGLGLAIARGIIQAHGGRIWVESERHDEQACPGSCFHVFLPGNQKIQPDKTGSDVTGAQTIISKQLE